MNNWFPFTHTVCLRSAKNIQKRFKSGLQGCPGGSDGKESACSAGGWGLIPESGRSPGEDNATHSSILAWRIPWTEEPGGQSWTRLNDYQFWEGSPLGPFLSASGSHIYFSYTKQPLPSGPGDVLRVKRLHSRGTSLPSSHVRYIPRASTSADSVLPFTAYNTTWDF